MHNIARKSHQKVCLPACLDSCCPTSRDADKLATFAMRSLNGGECNHAYREHGCLQKLVGKDVLISFGVSINHEDNSNFLFDSSKRYSTA